MEGRRSSVVFFISSLSVSEIGKAAYYGVVSWAFQFSIYIHFSIIGVKRCVVVSLFDISC